MGLHRKSWSIGAKALLGLAVTACLGFGGTFVYSALDTSTKSTPSTVTPSVSISQTTRPDPTATAEPSKTPTPTVTPTTPTPTKPASKPARKPVPTIKKLQNTPKPVVKPVQSAPKSRPAPPKPAPKPAPKPTPRPNPTYASGMSQFEVDLLALVWKARGEWCGPDTLESSPVLNEYARNWSYHMSFYGMSHSPLEFPGVAKGENVAAGQSTPEEAMADFMASPPHKTTIMNCTYDQVGIGYVAGGAQGHYWTQLFAKK